VENRTTYFDSRGPANTEATLLAALGRARELSVRTVLVATSHGGTALKAAELFTGSGIRLVAVSLAATFTEQGWTMSAQERARVEAAGVTVLTTLHALADGIPEAFFGPATPGTIVAETLRCFSQGTKVAVEISLMAVEAGVVQAGEEIIAVAGSSDGADTAVVLRPSAARAVKDLRICELICKPRLA
jgi:uncharacterized protein